jgi:hypothetical protein
MPRLFTASRIESLERIAHDLKLEFAYDPDSRTWAWKDKLDAKADETWPFSTGYWRSGFSTRVDALINAVDKIVGDDE